MTASISLSPVLCVYTSTKDAAGFALEKHGIDADVRVFTFSSDHAEPSLACAALRACCEQFPGEDIVLLRDDIQLPDGWWPRLCAARTLPYDVISPLSNAISSSDPFTTDTRPHWIDDADAFVWMLSDRHPIQANTWLGACSLWRSEGIARFVSANTQLIEGDLPIGCQAAWLDHLYVAVKNTPTTASQQSGATVPDAIINLRTRITRRNGCVPVAVGRDTRPVILHVLHSWGGGVQHFVESLMTSSQHYRHLALVAQSNSERQLTGESLALFDDLTHAPLARWPLTQGIKATELASLEYRAILQRVLRDFRVSHVMVSSLIGHSLDVLETGLPTSVVCHDYYPLWPELHTDFGDSSNDFSLNGLKAFLAKNRHASHFSESRPEAWLSVRERYTNALLAAKATLFFPSDTVKTNLLRIEPRLTPLQGHLIPHGLPAWPKMPKEVSPPARPTLRVLVLGRINGGKGEDLLAELFPQCPSDIEFLLLGSGRAGMRFFGMSGVHVRMDYQRDELPALIETFAPDLALMPVTVAETFSYTLSELWSLGIPVLATRIGSLAERIQPGRTGLLVPPNAHAVCQALTLLRNKPSVLQALRKIHPQPTLAEMSSAYEAALPKSESALWPELFLGDSLQANVKNALEKTYDATKAQLDIAQETLHAQQKDIVARTEWADDLQAQLDARLTWARSLESDLASAREALSSLTSEFDDRTRWAFALQEELTTMNQELAKLNATMDRDRLALEENRNQLAQANGQLIVTTEQLTQAQQIILERDQHIAQLTASLLSAMAHGESMQRDRDSILASRSWRLTKPLRYANRLVAGLFARIKFKLQRLLSLQRRGLNSLRTRGVSGTMDRLRQELRPAPIPVTISVPDPNTAIDVDSIVLPQSEQPLVSIVIPVYNHLDATLICLQSLAQTKNLTPHEIIVVDDCSSDASPEQLPKIHGLRYQRNPENTGFIGACNAGAANARGEFVLFLNNDTAVQDGWLDALVETFEQHTDVGLVGAKLVYPDGRLQEAGGIVFSDGSGWNYGRFDDPAKPEYNFVREVDYCSGAAIMLRTRLFNHFGGFDSYYAPAYYEDTDLAMKVRQAGMRVLYQPASVVVHYEGISSGTDTSSGTKRFQVINQEKFLARWKDQLASHASPGTDIVIARQHRSRKRVLVIDATTPQPDHDSGSLRLHNIFRLLLDEGHAVTFFADNRAYVERYSASLQQLGVEVLWHPYLADPVSWFEDNGHRLDLVFVARHYIASSYVDLVRTHAPKARLAFDTVDLHYLREQRAAELAGSNELARTAEQTREKELALVRSCDVTLVVSPVEKELLEREVPGANVDILSNVHEVFGRRKGFNERNDVMFVGGYQHPPNIDAAIWFATEILPIVHQTLPDLKLHLIGSKAPAEVRALGELPGVVFHGFVENIEPFLDNCRLSVAPLRYGAGVKGKVNMSMSYGQPVVATGIAVEGMFAEPQRDVLVAEDPETFAQQVVRAYSDESLWESLSDNGLANVTTHFSFESARTAIKRLLEPTK